MSVSDDSTLIDNNANNIESTDSTEVTKDYKCVRKACVRKACVRKAKYEYVRKTNFNTTCSEKCALQRFSKLYTLYSNAQINIVNINPILNKTNELIKFSIGSEVLVNNNLVKQQIGSFNSLGNKVVLLYKSRLALHSLRVKEAQVFLRKLQVNLSGQTQGYTLSEVEVSAQLWKMFIEKIGISEYQFPLSEQSDHTTSVPASVFPSLPRYCSDVMWCTVRGGNSNATATLQKVRMLFKQAVPKARSLPSSYAKPLQQAPVPSAGGNLPHSDLAISPKSKAELNAQSNLNDHSLLNLFPRTKTSLKAFYRPMPPLQGASSSELLDTVQEFLPSRATSSVLDSKDIPSGRQVPNDPQGSGQQGQGSYQEQSNGATSGSVQSGGGVGGQGGACGSGSGGNGGDGDRPRDSRRSHYDEEVTEDEDDDEDPKPKPKSKSGLDNEESAEIHFMKGIPEQNTHGTDQCCPPKLSVPRVSRRNAYTGTCTVGPLFPRPVPVDRPVAHFHNKVSASTTQQTPYSPTASPPTSSDPPSPTHSSDSAISNMERFDELVTGALYLDNAKESSSLVEEETQLHSNLEQVQSTLLPFLAEFSENNVAAVPEGDNDDEQSNVSHEPEKDD